MYKILLADDESIVIEALTFIIGNAYPDSCEIAEAKSGRQLIERAESFQPDLCFVDIEMPGINGIAAMKEIRETMPNVIFIVVSAFNEFDYAQDAIRLGVMEYLNKPIEKDRILDVLARAFEKVDRMKAQRTKDLETQEKLEIVTPIIEHGLIFQITNELGSGETLDHYLTLLGLRQSCGQMMVLQFGDGAPDKELTNAIGVSIRLDAEAERVSKAVRAHFKGITGPFMGNTMAVYLPCAVAEDDDKALGEYQKTQLQAAQTLCDELHRALKTGVRIAFGAVHVTEDVSASYKEALRALKHEEAQVVYAKRTESAGNFIRKAKGYIDTHFARDLSLDEVAEYAGVSPHYLSKLFKKETASGFVEYLTEVRLTEAKELLLHSDKPVKEIGILVGYPDQNYFSRIFKNKTGQSPTEFKEAGQKT